MKRTAILFLSTLFTCNQVYAMTTVDVPNAGAPKQVTTQTVHSGKVDAIHAGASQLVIGGVTYAYNPLTTVVTVNGKRATISDVRRGDNVQFEASTQATGKHPLLTTVSTQRQ